jgi:hypothetical protein
MFKREEPPKPFPLMATVRAEIGQGERRAITEGTIRARWYATDGSGWHYSVKSNWMKLTHPDVPHARVTVIAPPTVIFGRFSRATPRVPGARYRTGVASPA